MPIREKPGETPGKLPNPTPDFSPGQGWHRDGSGYRIPGCESDLIDRLQRAWPGFVLRLRCGGERIPAQQLQRMEPTGGGVLMMDTRTGSWNAHLYDLPDVQTPLLVLEEAQLKRHGADYRQYVGMEHVGRERWPQTWLCTATLERMAEILARMVERELFK